MGFLEKTPRERTAMLTLSILPLLALLLTFSFFIYSFFKYKKFKKAYESRNIEIFELSFDEGLRYEKMKWKLFSVASLGSLFCSLSVLVRKQFLISSGFIGIGILILLSGIKMYKEFRRFLKKYGEIVRMGPAYFGIKIGRKK